MTDAALARLARSSVALIRRCQAPSGAFPASPSFPTYRFCWLRDGAFIADAMSRAGERESAEAFFGWCARVLEARADRVERLVARREAGEPVAAEEHLDTRYTVEGAEDPGEWARFQLDGYGAWLWSLAAHVVRHGADPAPFLRGAELSARYVAAFWDEPCFDWWEERVGVHSATLAAVAAGLEGAERLGVGGARPEIAARIRASATDGRLCVSEDDERVDASLAAVATPFGAVPPDDPLADATVGAIERELGDPAGGIHRNAADTYYGGGAWLLLTALVGWYRAERGDVSEARRRLGWVAANAGPDGALPEQVDAHLLHPAERAAWVERWGPSASPLLWSHALYLDLALALGVPCGATGE